MAERGEHVPLDALRPAQRRRLAPRGLQRFPLHGQGQRPARVVEQFEGVLGDGLARAPPGDQRPALAGQPERDRGQPRRHQPGRDFPPAAAPSSGRQRARPPAPGRRARAGHRDRSARRRSGTRRIRRRRPSPPTVSAPRPSTRASSEISRPPCSRSGPARLSSSPRSDSSTRLRRDTSVSSRSRSMADAA